MVDQEERKFQAAVVIITGFLSLFPSLIVAFSVLSISPQSPITKDNLFMIVMVFLLLWAVIALVSYFIIFSRFWGKRK